jgi:hypothetical protein
MKQKIYFKIFSFFASVVVTADIHSFANISANFRKNLKWSQWYTQGPRGHWLLKKIWWRKSCVRLPLISYFYCIYSLYISPLLTLWIVMVCYIAQLHYWLTPYTYYLNSGRLFRINLSGCACNNMINLSILENKMIKHGDCSIKCSVSISVFKRS